MQKQNNKQNKNNGKQIDFYESGEARREYYLVKGLKHGNDTWYYENGQVDNICPYVNGEIHGEYISYYKNGKKYQTTSYVNDNRHGQCINFYENGNVESECVYVNGEKHGVQKRFYETGQLSRLTTYEHGIRHGEENEYQLDLATGEYFLLGKEIFENGNCELYTKLEKGSMFMCEDKYYKITRGNITKKIFGWVKKSNNLKVVLMKWELQHSVIVPSDNHSKKVHHIDRYELVEDGASMTLMTFNKNMSLTPFLEASLAIEWKTENERAEKLSKITNMLTN